MRYAIPRQPRHPTAEQRLMIAMLEDCLRTVLGRPSRQRTKWQQRDLAWIASHDRDDVFAFENVCEAVGIEPSYLRTLVLAALSAPRQPRPWSHATDREIPDASETPRFQLDVGSVRLVVTG